MRIASSYVESKEEAETILNDSFLKVFDNINKFDTTKPFKPWFRRILTNTAINFANSCKKYARRIQLEAPENFPNKHVTESQISYEELIATVRHLSSAYRDVFNLYVIDGYKHQEIANLLGISVSTSKSNLTRARQKLRVLIAQKFRYIRA